MSKRDLGELAAVLARRAADDEVAMRELIEAELGDLPRDGEG